jgi:hypothetical protein
MEVRMGLQMPVGLDFDQAVKPALTPFAVCPQGALRSSLGITIARIRR